jgi:hypothetical protein
VINYTPVSELPPYYMRIPRNVRRIVFRPPAWAHGTADGYYAYACLCARCRAFSRDYRRSLTRYHRKRAAARLTQRGA